MKESIDTYLAKAVINFAIFLEFTNSGLLDEDTAVSAMEQLASDLQSMDQSSQNDLAASFMSLVSDYKGDIQDFVAKLPETLGLA